MDILLKSDSMTLVYLSNVYYPTSSNMIPLNQALVLYIAFFKES